MQHLAYKSSKGVALITVLSLIALLTITLVAFFALVQDDRQRAREFLDYSQSTKLIESAFQEALGKIIEGSEAPWAEGGEVQTASMTASPGLMEIRYYNRDPNRGNGFGPTQWDDPNSFVRNPFARQYNGVDANPRWIPLFSWQRFAPGIPFLDSRGGTASRPNPDYNPAAVFNLNNIDNPFFPGELYLSGTPSESFATKFANRGPSGENNFPDSNDAREDNFFQPGESSFDRPFYVQWIPVLANPFEEPSEDNPLVGRYAYWVDVENTKIHLNTNTRSLFDDRDDVGQNISTAASLLGVPMGDAYADLPLVTDTNHRDNLRTWDNEFIHLQKLTSISSIVNTPWNQTRLNLLDGLPIPSRSNGLNFTHRNQYHSSNGSFAIDTTNTGYATISSGGLIELDSAPGNNFPQNRLFDLYLGWSPRLRSATNWQGEHPREDNLPIFADHSLIDWDVFTGKRPLYEGFGVSNMRLERLVQPYARANLELNDSFSPGGRGGVGRFNSFTELWSMVDPEGQNQTLPPPNPNLTLGDAYLQSIRRTFGMSATIHGYEEERDPLGRPKIDIVALQNQLNSSFDLNTGLAAEIMNRLQDSRYHRAYFPGRLRPYVSDENSRSFAQSMNRFAGDGEPGNDNNGRAVARQILANIGGYAKSTLSDMASYANSFASRTDGVWPALPIPYVMEVTTRGRNSLWLLAFDEANGDDQQPLSYKSRTEASLPSPSEVTVDDLFSNWTLEAEDPNYEPESVEVSGVNASGEATYEIRSIRYTYSMDNEHSILRPFIREREEGLGDGVSALSLEGFVTEISLIGSDVPSFASGEIEFDVIIELEDPIDVGTNPNPDASDIGGGWDSPGKGLESVEIHYYLDTRRTRQFLIATNAGGTGEGDLPDGLGSDLTNYLENIIVDMAFALANPNPFFVNEEDWSLDYSFEFDNDFQLLFWDNGNRAGTNEFSLNIPELSQNNYTMRPGGGTGGFARSTQLRRGFSLLSHNVMARGDYLFATLRTGGDDPFTPFNFSEWVLAHNPDNVPQLRGWEISHGGNLLHKVPNNSLGSSSTPVPWWDMSGEEYNVGFAPMFSENRLPSNSDGTSRLLQWQQSFKPFQENRHWGASGQWNQRYFESGSNPWTLRFGQSGEDELTPIPIGWFAHPTIISRWDSGFLAGNEDGFNYIDDINWDERHEDQLDFFKKEAINIFIGRDLLNEIGSIYEIPIVSLAHQEEENEHPSLSEESSFEENQLSSFGFVLHNFMRNVRNGPPMLESIVSIDPALGHRTVNTSVSVNSDFGNLEDVEERDGHFYGALGHTWRRHSQQFSPFSLVPSESTAPPESIIVGIYETQTTTEIRTIRRPVVIGNRTVWIEEEVEVEVSERVRVGEREEFALVVTSINGVRLLPTNMATSMRNPASFDRNRQEVAMGLNLLDYRAMYNPVDQSSPLDRELENPARTRRTSVIPIPFTGVYFDEVRGRGSMVTHRSIFSHAPRGGLMVNIGELGLVHSGLVQMPIDLAGYTPSLPFYSGFNDREFPPSSSTARGVSTVNISEGPHRIDSMQDIGLGQNAVGAPQNGPPMSMLLDLFTPGAFRDSLTGRAHSKVDWERSGSNVPSNSPLRPRRGTWSVNTATASDNYLAYTSGDPQSPAVVGQTDIPGSTLHPVWVPSAMGMQFMQADRSTDFMLDPWMNYFPRYRRGFENLITTIGGDFTPDRSQGVGVWRDQWDMSRPNYYFGPLNLPVYSFVNINDEIGAWFENDRRNFNARLVTAGHRISGTSDSLFSGHLNIDSLFSYNGNHLTGTLMEQGVAETDYLGALNAANPAHRLPLERITRFAISPMRHNISELNRNALDSSEQISQAKHNSPGGRTAEFGFSYLNTALNPSRFFANMTQAGTGPGQGDFHYTQILGAGPAGNEWGRGIFRNAPYVVSANQISTSANVFTIHMVAQAIRDSGENDQDNGALNNWGDFSFSDQVLSEQWARAVVARVPSESTRNVMAEPAALNSNLYRNPQYEYKVLYYRVVDNPR